VKIKVQVAEMKARGMQEAAVAVDVERLRAMENDFRKITSKEEVMWFGPEQYTDEMFWDFFFANAQEALRKQMGQDVFQHTKKELAQHFDEEQQYGWLKRGYNYSLKAIRKSLLDHKYAAYFDQKAKEAEVKMNPKIEKKYLK
jgi:hypothetical protein